MKRTDTEILAQLIEDLNYINLKIQKYPLTKKEIIQNLESIIKKIKRYKELKSHNL
jgi:hypothetical protein